MRPRSKPITRHLLTDGGIDLEKVDGNWLHWFGQTLTEAVGPATATQLVERLNALAAPSTHLGDTP